MEVDTTPFAIAASPPATPATAASTHDTSFHDVLSALNPLQYLPVIGTIYRTLTGDQIPEPLRRVGSLIVSGLLGGPIGVMINLATLAAEKVSGIDLDQTGQSLLAELQPAPAVPSAMAAAVPDPSVAADPTAVPANAWSPTQLAAYGVDVQADGTLARGALVGAELLNTLELGRIRGARLAYDRAMTLAG